MSPFRKKALLSLSAVIILTAAFAGYKVFKWKAYAWLPAYFMSKIEKGRTGEPGHIIFVFVDHYEPGRGEKGVKKNAEWLARYRELADRHRDSYGRKPQHTWFYAYDHHNDRAVADISRAVYEGYGELEFHWHHGEDSNEGFAVKIDEALDWFASYGAMTTGNLERHFGFIHGNWALDNTGKPEHCGVSRELDILKKAGCYADFTFPALGHLAQPPKVNSIYYAKDDDSNGSYFSGIDSKVGAKNSRDLMIFEGPIEVIPSTRLFEYGAVETDNEPSRKRVESWIASAISVKGRPEWVFVKVYTHGVQGKEVFFSKATDDMFTYLEERYAAGGTRLHYVAAREAYNIVRAAEDGLKGDPDAYRDYELKQPVNRSVSASVPVEYRKADALRLEFVQAEGLYGNYEFSSYPVKRAEGAIKRFIYSAKSGQPGLELQGTGKARIYSSAPLLIKRAARSMEDGLFVYEAELE